MPPLGGFPSEYRCPLWYGITRMVSLPDGEKILKISLFVLAQLRNVTDRRTPGDSIYRAYAYASRGKNRNWKLICVASSSECREQKGVDLSDYKRYLNQIWYRAQAPYSILRTWQNVPNSPNLKSKMTARYQLECSKFGVCVTWPTLPSWVFKIFIFGHMTEFQFCCHIPKFINIRQLLLRYGNLTILNFIVQEWVVCKAHVELPIGRQ